MSDNTELVRQLLELRGVTGVADCSAEAVAKWEKHPWSS